MNKHKTIYELLNEKGFDFDRGRVVIQQLDEDYREVVSGALNASQIDLAIIENYADLDCDKRFIAIDAEAMYVLAVYDASFWVQKLPLNLNYYLNKSNIIPIVGGR